MKATTNKNAISSSKMPKNNKNPVVTDPKLLEVNNVKITKTILITKEVINLFLL